MTSISKFLRIAAFVALALASINSEAGRLFGLEFELGAVDRVEREGEIRAYRFIELMRHVQNEYNSNRSIDITRWHKDPSQPAATFEDPKGRVWEAVPEYINMWGLDGYELVTPPLDSGLSADLETVEHVATRIKEEGKFGPGMASSTHVTLDASDLITNSGDCERAIKTILFIESHWPEIYSAVSPIRYGTVVNEYAVPLSANQKELLNDLARLLSRPPQERTKKAMKEIFDAHLEREKQVRVAETELAVWKFRAANYMKFLGLNGSKEVSVFEFRIPDFLTAERIRPTVALFKAIMDHGADLTHSFVDPFAGLGGEPTLVQLSERVQALDQAKYDRFLRRLGLIPEAYPKLGATGGLISRAVFDSEVSKLSHKLNPEAKLQGDSPEVLVRLRTDRGTKRLTSLAQIPTIDANKRVTLQITLKRPPVSLATLASLGERLRVAGEALAVKTEPAAPLALGAVQAEPLVGGARLTVSVPAGDPQLVRQFLSRLLVGLEEPRLLSRELHLSAPESLVDRIARFKQRYYKQSLSWLERRRLEAVEAQANKLPLMNFGGAPSLSPTERVIFTNADQMFDKTVYASLRQYMRDEDFLNAYRATVREWLLSTSLEKSLVSQMLLSHPLNEPAMEKPGGRCSALF